MNNGIKEISMKIKLMILLFAILSSFKLVYSTGTGIDCCFDRLEPDDRYTNRDDCELLDGEWHRECAAKCWFKNDNIRCQPVLISSTAQEENENF